MGKILLAALLTLAATGAHADNNAQKVVTNTSAGHTAQKIAILKKMYSKQGMRSDYFPATPTLKNIFKRAEALSTRENGDLCIDHDPITQGAYPEEIARTARFRALANGNIEVRFKNFGSTARVEYRFICSQNRCLIDDLIEEEFGSFRNSTLKCLH